MSIIDAGLKKRVFGFDNVTDKYIHGDWRLVNGIVCLFSGLFFCCSLTQRFTHDISSHTSGLSVYWYASIQTTDIQIEYFNSFHSEWTMFPSQIQKNQIKPNYGHQNNVTKSLKNINNIIKLLKIPTNSIRSHFTAFTNFPKIISISGATVVSWRVNNQEQLFVRWVN